MSTFTQTAGRGLSGYRSPELQTVEVEIEQGFAASPIDATGGVTGGEVTSYSTTPDNWGEAND